MLWLINGSDGESHLRRSWRNWFPVRMLEPAHLCQRRKKITNVSLDPCRLPLVVRLPLSLFPLGTSELKIYSCCLIKDGCAPSITTATLSSTAFTLSTTPANVSSTWATLSSTPATLSLTFCVPFIIWAVQLPSAPLHLSACPASSAHLLCRSFQ